MHYQMEACMKDSQLSTKKRAKFLFNDGEFKQKIVPMKKKKMINDLRDQEACDELETEIRAYEGSTSIF